MNASVRMNSNERSMNYKTRKAEAGALEKGKRIQSTNVLLYCTHHVQICTMKNKILVSSSFRERANGCLKFQNLYLWLLFEITKSSMDIYALVVKWSRFLHAKAVNKRVGSLERRRYNRDTYSCNFCID